MAEYALKLTKHDTDALTLCIAVAWLYGTISVGRARELAISLGCTARDIEELRFIQEQMKEFENTHCSAVSNPKVEI